MGMGATTGMIAIIGIAIIATGITGTKIIATTTGIAIMTETEIEIAAMTATTGVIDNPKPVQRCLDQREEKEEPWASPTFPWPEESPSPD